MARCVSAPTGSCARSAATRGAAKGGSSQAVELRFRKGQGSREVVASGLAVTPRHTLHRPVMSRAEGQGIIPHDGRPRESGGRTTCQAR